MRMILSTTWSWSRNESSSLFKGGSYNKMAWMRWTWMMMKIIVNKKKLLTSWQCFLSGCCQNSSAAETANAAPAVYRRRRRSQHLTRFFGKIKWKYHKNERLICRRTLHDAGNILAGNMHFGHNFFLKSSVAADGMNEASGKFSRTVCLVVVIHPYRVVSFRPLLTFDPENCLPSVDRVINQFHLRPDNPHDSRVSNDVFTDNEIGRHKVAAWAHRRSTLDDNRHWRRSAVGSGMRQNWTVCRFRGTPCGIPCALRRSLKSSVTSHNFMQRRPCSYFTYSWARAGV